MKLRVGKWWKTAAGASRVWVSCGCACWVHCWPSVACKHGSRALPERKLHIRCRGRRAHAAVSHTAKFTRRVCVTSVVVLSCAVRQALPGPCLLHRLLDPGRRVQHRLMLPPLMVRGQ